MFLGVWAGTNSPDQTLDIESSSNTTARVTAHGYICRDNYGSPSSLGSGMMSPASNSLAFTTNSTERVRIDSSGDVGIGNDASFPLFTDDRSLILGAGSGSVGLQIHSSTTGYGGLYFGDSKSGSSRYSGYVGINIMMITLDLQLEQQKEFVSPALGGWVWGPIIPAIRCTLQIALALP